MAHSSKRILVTGADGFIGSHLAEELVRQGHQVRALVLYNAFGSEGWLADVPPEIRGSMDIVMGDVRDPHGTRRLMEGCDTVLHLAALIGIPWSYHAPDAYVETNIKGTLNVLQAAKDLGVERVVQTSTSEVYGTAQTVPMTEDHPLCGQSPYAATKIGADQLALSFHRSFGTPVVVLRPFNTFGPRQSRRAVIPTVIGQIAAGASRISLGATAPTRDFLFVEDTVRAFIAATFARDAVGQVIHVGTGHEISIGDLVTTIADLMGATVSLDLDPERLRPRGSEVHRLCCDASRAKTLLGWEPRLRGREGLREGLRETIAWCEDPTRTAVGRAQAYVL
jgi:NAD dependent epimerase/dehydratase